MTRDETEAYLSCAVTTTSPEINPHDSKKFKIKVERDCDSTCVWTANTLPDLTFYRYQDSDLTNDNHKVLIGHDSVFTRENNACRFNLCALKKDDGADWA